MQPLPLYMMRAAVLISMLLVAYCDLTSAHDAALRYRKYALRAAGKQTPRLLESSGLTEVVMRATENLKGQISTSCKNATSTLMTAIREQKNWALQILDASGKPIPSGIMVGNLLILGSYWECVNSSGTLGIKSELIRGQYCTVSWGFANQSSSLEANARVRWGVCIPDACNSNDLYEFMEQVKYMVQDFPKVGAFLKMFSLVNTTCQNNDMELTSLAIAGICLASVFVGLVIIGSAYEIVVHKTGAKVKRGLFEFISQFKVNSCIASRASTAEDDQSRLITNEAININTEAERTAANSNTASSSANMTERDESTVRPIEKAQHCILGRCLSVFSIRLNGSAIFSTMLSDEQLNCLHGMRFISMVWIITGHTYIASAMSASEVLLAYEHYANSWTFQVFWNATFSVDTFFVISGLLTTYVTLNYIRRVGGPGRFKWYMFYIHRYLRLTPVYGMAMFMYISVFPYLSTGPLWIQQPDSACIDYWWTFLLYINNFFAQAGNSGFGHAWYLANDMQFFVLSPVVIVALFLWPLLGVVLILALVGVSVISTAVITSVNQFSADFMSSGDNNVADSLGPITEDNDIYVKPYCRIGSYAIGMLVGYILYRTKRKLKLNPWVVVFGWIISTTLACTVLFCLYDTTRGATTLSTADSAAYLSLSRIAWSLSIGWIVLACSTGYGGWANDFLSWKVFAPLSRLTYCAYLVHMPLLSILFSYLSYASDIREFPIYYYATGNIVMAYAVALAFSLTFEAPFLGLEKLIFKRTQ